MSQENTAEVIEISQPETPTDKEDRQEQTPKDEHSEGEPKEPENQPEDLDAIEEESDTDEDGNEKTVSLKRVKGMAKQAKKYQAEIKELQSKVDNSIPAYDVHTIRESIGNPSSYNSMDDYDDALYGYVNQQMHNQVQIQIRKAKAISNFHNQVSLLGGVDLESLPDMPETHLIMTAESKAAGHIASMLIDNKELAEVFTKASPNEVRDFIRTTEGQLQSMNEQSQKSQQIQAQTNLDNLVSGVESLTGGRLSGEKLKGLQVPSLVAEAITNLDAGPELTVYLHDKPESVKKLNELGNMNPYAAMVELGRLEAKAMFYSRSNEFKSKYPKSSSFEADKALRGGATAPKGLNTKDDAEFNRRYNQKKGK